MKINTAQFKNFISNLLEKKTVDEVIETAKKSELKKTLGAFDLIILGIGAVVGTGIFTIVGSAIVGGPEGAGAGPAIILSMVLAAIASIFSALCYSEIAAMIPIAGSAYTYTYITMGEFMAWLVGWILMLEYAIGNITIASAWSGYFAQFLKGFKQVLPDFITTFPIWLRNDYRSINLMCDRFGYDIHDKVPFLFDKIPFAINLPAIFIVVLLTLILVKGVRESTRFAGIMVAINLFIISTFIFVGAHYVQPENWMPFMPNGFSGVVMGAFLIFFAYIGFDAISTTAEETKNPQKDIPIGILGTLCICTVLYIGVALVLTGMVPCKLIDIQAPIAHAMHHVGKDWFAGFISAGALAGLTSVLLVYQLGTVRILYAMSRDKFLPRNLRVVNRKTRVPNLLTWVCGLVVIIGSLFMDLNISAELCNFGTFTSFIIICIIVLILRKTDPDRKRPFKVPFVPLFPILGILFCGGLIVFSLKTLKTSSVLFPIWIIIGVMIYFAYGYRAHRNKNQKR